MDMSWLSFPLRRAVASLLGLPLALSGSDDDRLEPISPRVLLVVYDPVVDQASGEKLSQHKGWQNIDALVAQYIGDLEESSGGLVRYQVVQRIDRDEFPPKSGGFRYTPETYFIEPRPPRAADWADYNQVAADLDLVRRVSAGEIDEVWIFNFPYAGFYESRMAGRYAFYCNAPPLDSWNCPRRFVIMGFSPERHVAQMLENFGHRVEFILAQIYQYTRGEANLYERFRRYDQIAPGQAEVGSVHFGPNSESDYDYSNPRFVPSRCDDWLNFPNFTGAVQQVNCTAWGREDSNPDDEWTRPHHKWYLSHLPRAVGRTNGVANNWWKYVVDPNRV